MSEAEQKPTPDEVTELLVMMMCTGGAAALLHHRMIAPEEIREYVTARTARALEETAVQEDAAPFAAQIRAIIRKEVLAEVMAKAAPMSGLGDPCEEGWSTAFRNLFEWVQAELAPPPPASSTSETSPVGRRVIVPGDIAASIAGDAPAEGSAP